MVTAPIVLFVYNRPLHTKLTVEALKKNFLSNYSNLYIYSDFQKDGSQKKDVQRVRSYLKEIVGFKKISIIERKKNYGLAQNIIKGVSSVIKNYGKVIVLEDDMVTSPYFLNFMNDALSFYKHEKRVWSISGWNYPINSKKIGEAFLWRFMNCWGWATWSNRWNHFRKDLDSEEELTHEELYRFNLDDVENIYKQIEDNKSNKINTWAVFWYLTIFKKNGLCCNPSVSYVNNIGLDGSGEHCTPDIRYKSYLSNKNVNFFPKKIEEDKIALKRIKKFYKPSFINKIISRINNLF